jgi:predicted Rossmann fold nucleotide-binding protein DprA/Smf involved in DNA uptake
MRAHLKAAIDQGRMLFLSPFKAQQRRATAQMAVYRNLFVAAVADAIFVAHARPTGKTEQFCREVLGWKKTVYTLESDSNANLIDLGAKPVEQSVIALK